MTDAPAPVSDLPLSVAAEELTGFEVLVVEAYFKKDFAELGSVGTLLGCVWVYGNRGDKTMSWHTVKSMTLKQLSGMFAPEPEDADESDPDTELGKESSPAAPPTKPSPTGVSGPASARTSTGR